MALEATHGSIRVDSKLQESPIVVDKFNNLYEFHYELDQKHFINEKNDWYRDLRTFKEVLRSQEFNKNALDVAETSELVKYFLENPKYTSLLKDWVRTRTGEHHRKTLPGNAARVYSLAESEIQKSLPK